MKLKKVLKFIASGKVKRRRKRKTPASVRWENAADVEIMIGKLIKLSNLDFDVQKITTLRSYNSKARAYARIWGLSKVWQLSLNISPHYVIEVLSEKFDNLPLDRKTEVLLHELAHIPNNFSGSLLPHIRSGNRSFRKKVDKLIKEVHKNSSYRNY